MSFALSLIYICRESRYLLVLTENYAALRLLQGKFHNHDPVIIFGSSFPKDQQYTQVYFQFLFICMSFRVFKVLPYSLQILNNYRMRLSMISRIIMVEVCVILRSRWLRWITQTEALIILDIIGKPNSIIVLLYIFIYYIFI